MNRIHPVLQLARQSASKKFSALIQNMAQSADQALEQQLSVHSPTTDYSLLHAARHFLRKAGDAMLQKLELVYQGKLNQALEDIHSNAHIEVSRLSTANMALVDDQTIIRQIQVGHLAVKLGTTCSESLNQVNMVISQLLGRPEVKQQDNPFRPELIAQALTEVLDELIEHENVRHCLTQLATDALAQSLPEYYAELCEVFKAGGISPKLVARPTATHARENLGRGSSGASQERSGAATPGTTSPATAAAAGAPAAGAMPGGSGNASTSPSGALLPASILPVMQDLVQRLHAQAALAGGSAGSTQSGFSGTGAAGGTVQVNPQVAFQELISRVLGSGTGGAGSGSALFTRLEQMQQLAASGAPAAQGNPLLSLRQQMDHLQSSQSERMTLELVALLFELIGRDPQIPGALREQIGQLQIPFLKSTMLDPATLQQVDHPTRQLLNHMGMVSVGLPADSPLSQEVGSEFQRISNSLLSNYQNDASIFIQYLEQLRDFMNQELCETDPLIQRNIDAMEEFQRLSYLTQTIGSAVREMLAPLKLDQRVIDFCLNIWVHVLVKASVKIDQASGDSAKATIARLELFFNALPDLVWSAQAKSSTDDRLTLIRVLPKLVKIINSGLKGLQWPEQHAKQAMDQLLAVHAQILANNDAEAGQNLPSREELRQMFKFENIREQTTASRALAPPPRNPEGLKLILDKRGVQADLHIVSEHGFTSTVETDWLAAMQVGTSIECRLAGTYQAGRLIWVDQHHSLFMFRLDQNPSTQIYCDVSLSRALRDGAITFVEQAPAFERAIEALISQMGQVPVTLPQSASAPGSA